MADRRRPGLATIAAILLGAVLLVALLLTPAADDSRGRLTSTSAAPGGALALYELQRRSGWRVERRNLPYGDSLDARAVYAVLDPPVMLTAGEVHRLLQAVRAGAGLLVVVPESGALADSLGISHSTTGGPMDSRDEAPPGFCADSLNRPGLINWPGGRIQSFWLRSRHAPVVVFTRVELRSARGPRAAAPAETTWAAAPRDPRPPLDSAGPRRGADSSVIFEVRPVDGTRTRTIVDTVRLAPGRAAMAGYALGSGRVVAVADPDLLRNDVLRVCRWNAGPTAARALDWLAAAGGERLVFDEYHQDPGADADPLRAVRRALVEQPWGRMVVVAALGGLVFLAAAGLRPIAPVPSPTVERRSPLEHVRALARAYASAGSTRLVARRLVRGLRRRHSLAAPAGGDDVAFLRALAERRPALAADAASLERAMAEAVPSDRLPELGDAVARLDSTLRPHR